MIINEIVTRASQPHPFLRERARAAVNGLVLWIETRIFFSFRSRPASPPEGVKTFKTGRDREGEPPAKPHGARIAWAMARQEARPPNFHSSPCQGVTYRLFRRLRLLIRFTLKPSARPTGGRAGVPDHPFRRDIKGDALGRQMRS